MDFHVPSNLKKNDTELGTSRRGVFSGYSGLLPTLLGKGPFIYTFTIFRILVFIQVIRSDKSLTKCQSGHSELLTPRARATKQLEFDIQFQTVHNAKAKLWPLKVRW